MPRILVVGHCPLPFEATTKMYGPGLRTWQFTRALHDAGHDVLLVASRIPFVYGEQQPPESVSPQPRLKIVRVDERTLELESFLQRAHDQFAPDAIVAATIYPSYKAATLSTEAPLWLDFFGHTMAEAQAKTATYGDRRYLEHFWRWVQTALDRGSVFSTVSRRQEYATLGELGARGRLNDLTVGYRFAWPIPCAVEEEAFAVDPAYSPPFAVPDTAFVVLSTGGFNTWVDVPTLYRGVTLAMDRNPTIVFVATGGSITGHDEKTFPAFEALVRGGPFSDRFRLLGWRNKREIPSILARAHVAINVDKDLLEARLGSRNRFLDWSRVGLPFITTGLCELSQDLAERGLCWTVPTANPEALADAILAAAADPLRAQRGRDLREFCGQHYSIAATTKPLICWAANPAMAPDLAARGPDSRSASPIRPHGDWTAHAARIEAELRKKTDYLRFSARYIASVDEQMQQVTKRPWRFALARLLTRQIPSGRALPPLPPAPLVSVVIVSFNSAKFLPACLRSVFRSEYSRIEVVVVDNGSTDDSVRVVADGFPSVHLVANARNRGFAAANNQGFRAAAGDLVLMLNPDTEIDRQTIGAFVDGFHDAEIEGAPIAIAGCKILDLDGETLQHAGAFVLANALTGHIGARERDDGRYESPRDCDYVTACALCFPRHLLDRIGDLDEDYFPAYFEELDFCVRARGAGFRIAYLPQPRVRHHESVATGLFSRRFFALYHRGRLRFVVLQFPLRRLLVDFPRAEVQWLRRARPKDQLLPLLSAYAAALVRLPKWWVQRCARRQHFAPARRANRAG